MGWPRCTRRSTRFNRLVALKVLPRQYTHDPKYMDRFKLEAKMIARLEHPAIVPVYDYGEHDDAPYLVMRYMSGGSLAGRLARRTAAPGGDRSDFGSCGSGAGLRA